MEITLVDVKDLRPHEEIKQKNLQKMIKHVEKIQGYYIPILVDKDTKTILDGHHRYHSALHLGINRIPAIEINYLQDDSIKVKAWQGKEEMNITKDSILEAAKKGELYPPKTSKHILQSEYPEQFFSLQQLL
jgi:hypothetical protein